MQFFPLYINGPNSDPHEFELQSLAAKSMASSGNELVTGIGIRRAVDDCEASPLRLIACMMRRPVGLRVHQI